MLRVSIIEESDFDGMPGQSDTFFKYKATSEKELGVELKEIILNIFQKASSTGANSQ